MWPKSYARLMHRVTTRLAAIDRSRVETPLGTVEYAQRGTGPPLLVSHGIFGGFDAALDHADTYGGDRFRVIAPSRFGYLGSTIPADANVSGQAHAYAALLDHLGSTEPRSSPSPLVRFPRSSSLSATRTEPRRWSSPLATIRRSTTEFPQCFPTRSTPTGCSGP
jgi:hypothetical protein